MSNIAMNNDRESNKMVFECTPEAFQYLQKLWKSGELDKLLGVSVANVQQSEFPTPKTARQVNLSQWFAGVFAGVYQELDALRNPEQDLALSLRNPYEESVEGGRIIDLGVQLGNKKVALLVKITPEEEEDKRNILVQLYPTGKEKYLPPNLKLVMLSKSGKVLQEVESRNRDNYIQLLPFKNKTGKSFTLQVILGDAKIAEDIFVI